MKAAMIMGVFDDWVHQYKTLGPELRDKEYMFINELVLLWPFVCSSSLFKTMQYVEEGWKPFLKEQQLKVSANCSNHLGSIPTRTYYLKRGREMWRIPEQTFSVR